MGWRRSRWEGIYALLVAALVETQVEGEQTLLRVLDDVVTLQPHHQLDHTLQTHQTIIPHSSTNNHIHISHPTTPYPSATTRFAD
jgi:hypothetical protein